MSRDRTAYPSDYAAIFSTRQGQNVLEDLQRRFLITPNSAGIDRICDAIESKRAQDFFNHIYSMIDQHENGEHDNVTIEVSTDE